MEAGATRTADAGAAAGLAGLVFFELREEVGHGDFETREDRPTREQVANLEDFDTDADLVAAIRDRTGGRGPDAVIDAVGMEAHGSPAAKAAHEMTKLLPNALAEKLMKRSGVDRLAALHMAIELVRRGGTVSIVGVYGGQTDPMPMMTMFDKQIQMRMGQANVRRWADDILPLFTDDDPLGVDGFASHRMPLEDAPHGYEIFQHKKDGACKIVLSP